MLAESRTSGIVPSQTPPPHTNQQSGLPHPGEYLRLCPLLRNRRPETKNGPNERTNQNSRKIQLSNKVIANLPDAEFKTPVIRMLIEMVEYGCKIEGKVKVMQSKIEGNVQGINSDGKETRTQINGLEQKEEINIQPE